ncbi:MAG TPA: glycosyltransferase family 39 protein [Solirubrobacterales bacterium]|jgi:4-amino-4-deoxy-L-arabinose transferase-like glycosyltransferase|nr:glycosyltransferase family 39 protein [Solirubrobacterales bacterium]
MSGLAERNGGHAGLATLALILLLGLGLRVNEAWDGRSPVFDAAAYATIAANLDRDQGFTLGSGATQPASNYSPGLPLFAAGVYELSGGIHERLARVILALLGTLTVLFTYLLGRRMAGPAAGLIGAIAIAIYPALLEYQGMLMGEPLAAALLSAAVLASLWAADPPGASARERVRWLLPGILLGALALLRPEYLGVALLVSLVIFVRNGRREWSRTLVQALLVLAGVAVIVVPWTVRNAIALDRLVPISTGGGQVLFAGTYLPSDGDPEKVGAEVVERHPELFGPHATQQLRLEQILARLAAQRYPGMEPDKALSKMGKEQLWNDVSEEPLEYADFVAKKIARIWSHGPREVMREPGWELLHWALLVFGLAGLIVLALRRRWEALLIAAIFLAITAISALLVASPRRVLVMMPLLAALAGIGATAAWQQLRLSLGRTSL